MKTSKNNKRSIRFIEEVGNHDTTLEMRLLSYYIAIQLVWALVNCVLSFVVGMPIATVRTYGGFFIILIVLSIGARLFKKMPIFTEIYFVFIFIATPILWYMAGGGKSSASILFVCEIVVYAMCLSGKKQKVYVILSLVSSGMIQGFTRRLPNPVYPMDNRQYTVGGSILGLSTCILITAILLRQKKEYMSERDTAIKSEKELERSNSLQKNFLANMSHEIRSPLGIVLGFNNLISESNDITQIHEYAADIKQAGTTLLTVINDILDYSKIESGKLDIIEDDYSFKALIDGINRDVELKCSEKGLKYVTRIDDSIPDYLYGDNIRIKQCLLNLLSNAVKYTEQGVVLFAITCEDIKDDSYSLKFIVRDTGRGMSDELIPKLFSAFQRLDEGMNRGIEGTGLGLAITKNLLDEMDGSIEVESKFGTGSTFTIKLVQKKGKNKGDDVVEVETKNLDGVKILVVDDTQLNLVLIKKLLEKEGAVVKTIDNGKDCLADVEENKYDIIMLDHMMPEMNGVEVFEQMKENGVLNRETPVIMVTANAMAGASKEYQDIGFDGYISKPISATILKATVLQILGK